MRIMDPPPLTAAIAIRRAVLRYLARPVDAWSFPPQELLATYSPAELAWFARPIR